MDLSFFCILLLPLHLSSVCERKSSIATQNLNNKVKDKVSSRNKHKKPQILNFSEVGWKDHAKSPSPKVQSSISTVGCKLSVSSNFTENYVQKSSGFLKRAPAKINLYYHILGSIIVQNFQIYHLPTDPIDNYSQICTPNNYHLFFIVPKPNYFSYGW